MTASPSTGRTFPFSRSIPTSASEQYFERFSEVLYSLPHDKIDEITEVLWQAYRQDQALFLFGNGGSAALASHSACDFGKGTVVNGNRRFRVMSLTDNVALLTAWANDQHYSDVFAEQLLPLVRQNDVVLAISGSGNSENVIRALHVAREAGARTIGFTGFQGGRMKFLCDVCVIVPSDSMQLIEDYHVAITHAVFTALRSRIAEGCAISD
jgi:D-sedoheptulose 7-phosphate isomerase